MNKDNYLKRITLIMFVIIIGGIGVAGIAFYKLNAKINIILNDMQTENTSTIAQTESPDVVKADIIDATNINVLQKDILDAANIIVSANMADKVEEITKGLVTTEEKTIALAKWVCGNISNRKTSSSVNSAIGKNPYAWFAERAGLCRARAAVFEKMCAILNIPAKGLNM